MTPQRSLSQKALALLIVFSFLQLYVLVALAGPGFPLDAATAPTPPPQDTITGRVVTRNNQSILVNGNQVSTGDSVLTGAVVETPDQVGATINLGRLGSIDLAPNTKVQIEYSDGQIKVTLIQGCVIVRNKRGTSAQVNTDKGPAASNDSNQKQAAVLDVCYPSGAPSPIVNQGAAANAGAGGGGGGAAAGAGTKPWVWLVLLGGGATITGIALAHRGRNTSPSRP